MTEIDLRVRRAVYHEAIERCRVPMAAELGRLLGVGDVEIRAALGRLAEAHMLVLQPGGEILMANPFSVVPTPFVVTSGNRSWYANCIWDGMGVAAMLQRDVVVNASCGCCGAELKLEVPKECRDEDERVGHFAIPAAHWWDDIVFN